MVKVQTVKVTKNEKANIKIVIETFKFHFRFQHKKILFIFIFRVGQIWQIWIFFHIHIPYFFIYGIHIMAIFFPYKYGIHIMALIVIWKKKWSYLYFILIWYGSILIWIWIWKKYGTHRGGHIGPILIWQARISYLL